MTMQRIELIEKRHAIIKRQLARHDFLGQFDKENYEAVLNGLTTLEDAKSASREARRKSPCSQLKVNYRSMIQSLKFA